MRAKIRIKFSPSVMWDKDTDLNECISEIYCTMVSGESLVLEPWGQEWEVDPTTNTVEYTVNAVDAREDGYQICENDLWLSDIDIVDEIHFADDHLASKVEDVFVSFSIRDQHRAMPTAYGVMRAFGDYMNSIDLDAYQDTFGGERLEGELADYGKRANIKTIGSVIDRCANEYATMLENHGSFDH